MLADAFHQSATSEVTLMRILIIDDSSFVREMLTTTFQREGGYEVMCASDGVEGLTALYMSTPDVILLDLEMPSMDGLTFLETIRKQRQFENLPVVLLTSVQSRHVLLHAASLGVNACVLKSRFELSGLLTRIQEIVGEHRKVVMAGTGPTGYPLCHEKVPATQPAAVAAVSVQQSK